jgi:hypothetical protein
MQINFKENFGIEFFEFRQKNKEHLTEKFELWDNASKDINDFFNKIDGIFKK